MFTQMLESFKYNVVKFLSNIQIKVREEVDKMEEERQKQAAEAEEKFNREAEAKRLEEARLERAAAKVGRNDPCPCGSGKKYKNCCGKNK